MSEETIAGWALLLREDLPALIAHMSMRLGVSTAQCMDTLTPRDLCVLSSEKCAAIERRGLGESPAADSSGWGFFE